ncbi:MULTISPECIES: hypothetical protein [unclassified Janthinobacterium]|uniref:hypothetical protein n=1 Tax=unclassified Janthinobacterium TaxID=2610881 RepID=UPI00161D04D5|nr:MULTISPECIES: hypothetical protein [unclassified Janthinobacterium]MBB5610521.1 plasmid stability protein [Janthinobacterium sp. S3T4]MBB5616025.1 plasmid stability protein [Janthinobacterium sp. S3M3]
MKSRRADEERRTKEDARREQAAAFQEETRGRQRADWKKEDQYKADVEALNTDYFPPAKKPAPAPALGIQAPSAVPQTDMPAAETPAEAMPAPANAAASAPAPASAPAVQASTLSAAQAQGMPQAAPVPGAPAVVPQPAGMTTPAPAHKLTNMASSMDYFIRRAEIDMQHGKIDGPGMAVLYKMRSSAAKEGLNEAIQLLAQGDNDGAMRRFNENGDMKGWSVASSVDGVFEHAGTKLPTKIVTVKADDGSTRTLNTAQALVQNQKIEDLITQAQKGTDMADRRADATAGRKIQQQNADTNENYRLDQADNMREQRRLQGLGIDAKTTAGTAPIWGKEDDTFLKEQYSSKDELSGNKTFDGEGMQFAKQVAVARSRSNGGDAATASAYALTADANLKAQAKGDPVKLRQLRSDALQKLAAPSPNRAAAGDAEWAERTATSRAGAPAREDGRRQILMQELATEKDPSNIAALKRELAALGPASAPSQGRGDTVTNPFEDAAGTAGPAPTDARKPSFTVGGMSIAERDKRMDLFNKTVGGGADRSRFAAGMAARQEDVAANFDAKLAAIRPNMPRAEAQAVLTWIDEQSQAGTLSNLQLAQVRKARRAARM